jgi:membrane protease YdiL (CAAX protease family)
VLLPLLYWPLLEVLDKTSDDLEGPAQTLTDRANTPLDVVLLVLIVGLMAPVFEEIFYRGLMQRALLKRGLRPVLAIGITSVVFAATHFQLLQLPGLAIAGAVFGTLAYRADRLGPAIAAHLTFNMVTVIALLVA